MEKNKWSDYSKYLVLSDKSNSRLKANYESFTKFKKVMEVINSIAHSDKSSYLYEGDIYSRRITSTDAKKVIDNVQECKWTENTKKLFQVASQMKLAI